MSADNGIYILKTISEDGRRTYEYRVKHCQAIDNVYWDGKLHKESNNPDVWIENARNMWRDCKVFTTKDRAMVLAKRLYEEVISDAFCPVCEHGIQVIKIERVF